MGSKSTQTGRFYSCFRRSLTENLGIAIQGWDSGIVRNLSCAASAEKNSKISRRKDLPAGRGDGISTDNHMAGTEKIQWLLQAGRDKIMESWNGLDSKGLEAHLIPVPAMPRYFHHPMVLGQWELGVTPAKHFQWVLHPPSPNSLSHEKGRSWICLLFPIKACFGLGNPSKSHSLFMDCKQLACVMIPKSLGITLDIQMD